MSSHHNHGMDQRDILSRDSSNSSNQDYQKVKPQILNQDYNPAVDQSLVQIGGLTSGKTMILKDYQTPMRKVIKMQNGVKYTERKAGGNPIELKGEPFPNRNDGRV